MMITGGLQIKEIIYEVIIAVLVLSLLLVVIALFRGNMDLVALSAKKVEDVEKVKAEDMVPLDKNEATGADVISVIRYFCNDPAVEVMVTAGGETKSYAGETYSPDIFTIPYEAVFSCSYEYMGSKIKKVIYLQK